MRYHKRRKEREAAIGLGIQFQSQLLLEQAHVLVQDPVNEKSGGRGQLEL